MIPPRWRNSSRIKSINGSIAGIVFCCIVLQGLVPWTACFSYISVCHYFLWGHFKAEFLLHKPQSLKKFKDAIRRKTTTVQPGMVRRACGNFEKRVECLHNNGRHLNGVLNSSTSLSNEGHVAHMGESRNAYRVLVGRPEEKRPLGRPRRRWEDNIKMDLREVGYDDKDWINLAQDRDLWRAYVRTGMNLRGFLKASKLFESEEDHNSFVSTGLRVLWFSDSNTESEKIFDMKDILPD
ncbi:hypothetical protein ANN_06549 [Periplaneta americana]|uniref:Uncharacterized protein n=1 Tax=Periplaneta americana TaxID=6978 RepID=A0ABQ8TG84_PERAM|nr:hypothetical protein ANN_06549 [Periplaneta americana]